MTEDREGDREKQGETGIVKERKKKTDKKSKREREKSEGDKGKEHISARMCAFERKDREKTCQGIFSLFFKITAEDYGSLHAARESLSPPLDTDDWIDGFRVQGLLRVGVVGVVGDGERGFMDNLRSDWGGRVVR